LVAPVVVELQAARVSLAELVAMEPMAAAVAVVVMRGQQAQRAAVGKVAPATL
jgi:hypothetical protein